MTIKRPKGTNDIMGQDMARWHYLEDLIRKLGKRYGYEEIRTPIFEETALFSRGVGETTDVVEKEMYTFLDKGDRSLTLRPEGTASVVRAFIESRDYAQAQPTKYYYYGPMFRYARPQAGRYRQFYQYGVEAFGSMDPVLDADIIGLCMDFFSSLGIKGLDLHVNSVGCPACRPQHKKALQDYLKPSFDKLCPTCQNRFDKNPLRIFDCKNPACQDIVNKAPTVTSCLCADCRQHLDELRSLLEGTGTDYVLNEHLVRGLDYYTKTAFEVMVKDIGAQSSIGGGGRYDSLVEEIGGPAMSGIGFAVGIERTLRTLEAQGIELPLHKEPDVFVAQVDKAQKKEAYRLVRALRAAAIPASMDVMDRSLKAQFKYANKENVRYVITVGEEEVKSQIYPCKDMKEKTEKEQSLEEIIKSIKEEIK